MRDGKVLGEAVLYRDLRAVRREPARDRARRVQPHSAVKGWSVDRMRAAGARAADLLATQVGSYVPSLLAEHRRAGHLLVLATTTPDVLVRPLAAPTRASTR